MSEVILLKRSAVPAKVPLTTDLNLGELANNTYDGEIYIKKNDGTESIVRFVNFQHVSTDASFAANSDELVPSQQAVKTAVDGKQDELVSGTNIKTINGNSILGSGNLLIPLIPQKAGTVTSGSFSGNPKKTTITFSTAFADANFSVSVIGIDSRSWSVESVSSSGFTINANANSALSGNVYWVAKKHVTDMSGVVTSGNFSGNPKKTTITFNTPLADANYSVSVIGVNSRSWSIESVTSSSFIINARANSALTGNVYWTVTKHGEIS